MSESIKCIFNDLKLRVKLLFFKYICIILMQNLAKDLTKRLRYLFCYKKALINATP